MKIKRVSHKGQRTTESNQPGERRSASSPEHLGQRSNVSAGAAKRSYPFWDVWGGWRSLEAPRRQHRRRYCDQTSDEFVTWLVLVCGSRGKEGCKRIVGLLRPVIFEAPRVVYSVLGAVEPCAAAAAVALSLGNEWWISSVKQSTTRPKFAWLASVSEACHVELSKLPNK